MSNKEFEKEFLNKEHAPMQIIRHTNIIKGHEWSQHQEIYRYLPRDNKPPKLVATSLADLVDKLSDQKVEPRHIKNELLKGKNAKTKEEIYKIFLDRTGYLLNPTKSDFEKANKMEGLTANANIENIKFEGVKTDVVPSKERQKTDPWQPKAVSFLKNEKFDVNKENIKYISENLKAIARFNQQAKIKSTPEQSLLLEMQDRRIRKQISDRLAPNSKSKSMAQAQAEVIKAFPLSGKFFLGEDTNGNQSEFGTQYIDFKKLDKENLEENTELQRTANESLKEGSRYGLLVMEIGGMTDETNTVYPLTAEYMNDNVTLTNKPLAKKARQIGKVLHRKGVDKTKAVFADLGLNIDYDALSNADPEPKFDPAAYERRLSEPNVELD